MESTGRRNSQLRLAEPPSKPPRTNHRLMRLPEMRVTEPCLRALESESDRTGKSVYEIARDVIEAWARSRVAELGAVPAPRAENT